MRSTRVRALGTATGLLVLAVVLCPRPQSASPRFYDDDPIWHEVDTHDASGAAVWEPQLLYDLAENLFSRPGDADLDRRAMNVNTVDEVPDGSWFTNRAGSRPLTPEDVARGPDTSTGPAPGTWTVTAAKSDGVTPGFTIKDSAGQTWFIKFDPPRYRGMATGTEVAVTKLFWALGYHVPENYIATLRRDNLAIADTATITPPGARRRRMKPGDIDWLLGRTQREPSGGYRVVASKQAAGRFVGRIRFHGTRPDDPNDVVPHEHRRELRGYGVFAAWVNHVDAKSINTIDTLVSDNGKSVIRHYLLDFGSTLGSGAVGPRDYWEGDEYIVEPVEIGKGVAAFGFFVEPWRTKKVYESRAMGRMNRDNAEWDPEAWKPRVPNPAFLRARADDKFWAARKAMAITDEMIAAAVKAGQFGDAEAEAFLVRALIERRNAIGRRYLPAINPVVDPVLEADGRLRFVNAAVVSGVAPAPSGYSATWYTFDNATGEVARLGETTSPGEEMQAPPSLPTATGAFVKVQLTASSAPHPSWAQPIDAYFKRIDTGWKLVGLDRLPSRQ